MTFNRRNRPLIVWLTGTLLILPGYALNKSEDGEVQKRLGGLGYINTENNVPIPTPLTKVVQTVFEPSNLVRVITFLDSLSTGLRDYRSAYLNGVAHQLPPPVGFIPPVHPIESPVQVKEIPAWQDERNPEVWRDPHIPHNYDHYPISHPVDNDGYHHARPQQTDYKDGSVIPQQSHYPDFLGRNSGGLSHLTNEDRAAILQHASRLLKQQQSNAGGQKHSGDAKHHEKREWLPHQLPSQNTANSNREWERLNVNRSPTAAHQIQSIPHDPGKDTEYGITKPGFQKERTIPREIIRHNIKNENRDEGYFVGNKKDSLPHHLSQIPYGRENTKQREQSGRLFQPLHHREFSNGKQVSDDYQNNRSPPKIHHQAKLPSHQLPIEEGNGKQEWDIHNRKLNPNIPQQVPANTDYHNDKYITDEYIVKKQNTGEQYPLKYPNDPISVQIPHGYEDTRDNTRNREHPGRHFELPHHHKDSNTRQISSEAYVNYRRPTHEQSDRVISPYSNPKHPSQIPDVERIPSHVDHTLPSHGHHEERGRIPEKYDYLDNPSPEELAYFSPNRERQPLPEKLPQPSHFNQHSRNIPGSEDTLPPRDFPRVSRPHSRGKSPRGQKSSNLSHPPVTPTSFDEPGIINNPEYGALNGQPEFLHRQRYLTRDSHLGVNRNQGNKNEGLRRLVPSPDSSKFGNSFRHRVQNQQPQTKQEHSKDDSLLNNKHDERKSSVQYSVNSFGLRQTELGSKNRNPTLQRQSQNLNYHSGNANQQSQNLHHHPGGTNHQAQNLHHPGGANRQTQSSHHHPNGSNRQTQSFHHASANLQPNINHRDQRLGELRQDIALTNSRLPNQKHEPKFPNGHPQPDSDKFLRVISDQKKSAIDQLPKDEQTTTPFQFPRVSPLIQEEDIFDVKPDSAGDLEEQIFDEPTTESNSDQKKEAEEAIKMFNEDNVLSHIHALAFSLHDLFTDGLHSSGKRNQTRS